MSRSEPAIRRSELVPRFAERGVPYWPLTLSLAGLLLVAFMGIGPVLRDSAWWWVMAAVAVIVLLSAALFRRLRWPSSVVPLASAAVLMVVLTLFFGDGTGLLWLIPTPATVDVWSDLVARGMLSIQEQAVPAVAYPGIVFLLAIGAGGIAIVCDTVAITLRMPALAGVLVLIPVSIPTLVSKSGAGVFTLVLTAAVYLVMLRVDVRTRRSAEAANPDRGRAAARSYGPDSRGPGPVWGSVGVGAIAIVAALVLSAATPAISSSSVLNSSSNGVLFGSGVNPLIDLGQDLRRPEESLALHYSTTASHQPYLKLLTLDSFSNDRDWVATTGEVEPGNTVDRFGDPQGLTDKVDRDEVSTSVQIDGVVSAWLPVPYPATSVAGLAGRWSWSSDTLTVSSRTSSTRGQKYTVSSLELQPTAAQLRAAGADYPASIQQFVQLPDQMPEVIAATAQEATAGTTNPYDAAVALQRYLRSSAFTYSTDAPVAEGYDGGSIDVIVAFLDQKKGYCIHFASAMAVMARTLGIPSRLALGYLPGTSTRDQFEGETRYNVTSHDLHVWPELYFPGVGWVQFEPTTGRGSIPDYARAASSDVTTTTGPLATDRARTDDPLADRNAGGGNGTGGGADLGGWLAGAGIVAAVLLLLASPLIARRVQRWRRAARFASGAASASALWRELTATVVDYGTAVSETETARHLAIRLARDGSVRADAVSAALEHLLVAVERDRYARHPEQRTPEQRAGLVADLRTVLKAVQSSPPALQRVRGALLPRSLRPEALDPGGDAVPA